MDVEMIFSFLIEDYGLNYSHQQFHNCYSGNWEVHTYSFYNEHGCFTIYSLPQRGELDFYYASKFDTNLEKLCDRMINVRSMEEEIWEKHVKVGIFHNPFFEWNIYKVLNALAEVIKVHVTKHGEFFGIRVNRNV